MNEMVKQDILLCIVKEKEQKDQVVKALAEKNIYFYSKWENASSFAKHFQSKQDIMGIYIHTAQQKEAEEIAKRFGVLYIEDTKKAPSAFVHAFRSFMDWMKVIAREVSL